MSKSFHEIEKLLSVRAWNIILSLEVRDFTSFMALSKVDLLKARNCGKKTVKEIEGVQKLLLLEDDEAAKELFAGRENP